MFCCYGLSILVLSCVPLRSHLVDITIVDFHRVCFALLCPSLVLGFRDLVWFILQSVKCTFLVCVSPYLDVVLLAQRI